MSFKDRNSFIVQTYTYIQVLVPKPLFLFNDMNAFNFAKDSHQKYNLLKPISPLQLCPKW